MQTAAVRNPLERAKVERALNPFFGQRRRINSSFFHGGRRAPFTLMGQMDERAEERGVILPQSLFSGKFYCPTSKAVRFRRREASSVTIKIFVSNMSFPAWPTSQQNLTTIAFNLPLLPLIDCPPRPPTHSIMFPRSSMQPRPRRTPPACMSRVCVEEERKGQIDWLFSHAR